MQTMEQCLLRYRQRLRVLLDSTGTPSNPAVSDEWILNEIERLVYNLAKSGGTIPAKRILTAEEQDRIEQELEQALPDSILKDDHIAD